MLVKSEDNRYSRYLFTSGLNVLFANYSCYCAMSATSDREKRIDDQIRLVSVNADELLKTSSMARRLFGGSVAGSADTPSHPSPVVKGSNANSPITSIFTDDKISKTPAATTSTSELTTVSVCVGQTVQENDCLPVSSQSPRLLSLSSVSDNVINSEQMHIEAAVYDNVDLTNQPTSAVRSLPPSVLNESRCPSLPVKNSISETLEVLKNSCPLDRRDTIASSVSQMMASDKLNTDDVIASSRRENDTKISLPTPQQTCSDEGISEQSAQMERKETNTVNHRHKNSAVLRNDSRKKLSRIVSFTTEDFDLFQSKYFAACNLTVRVNVAYETTNYCEILLFTQSLAVLNLFCTLESRLEQGHL